MTRALLIAFTIFACSDTLTAQSTTFEDDFNRSDGLVGNGWSLWGNPSGTLVGGELRTYGSPRIAGGVARLLPVRFPVGFSFDFRSFNTTINPYNDSGWFVAFNASTSGYASPAQIKFYQYAGSLRINRETSTGTVDAQPSLSEPVRGWQDFTARPAHLAGFINEDLSASLTVTYSNGQRVSTSFGPASGNSEGALLLLGNSNGSDGPHIFDNIKIGPPTLERIGAFAQVASGNGWKTSMTLINSSAVMTTARIDFYGNDGSPLTLPLVFPQSALNMMSSSITVAVGPNASVVVESELQTSSIAVGWADVLATGPLTGYSIFRFRLPGLYESEGTVPLDKPSSSEMVLPYDNTNGYRTGVALANPTSSPVSIAMVVTDQNGSPISSSQVTLTAFDHASFFVTEWFSQSMNQLGTIRFQNGSGFITGVGLRFSPAGPFTSIPTIR